MTLCAGKYGIVVVHKDTIKKKYTRNEKQIKFLTVTSLFMGSGIYHAYSHLTSLQNISPLP